ncbi:MAG: class I SAM-dependent methyltransferase, partial [Acidimicrobiales bacterium]
MVAALTRHRPSRVAPGLAPLLRAFIGDDVALRVRFWDDSTLGPEDARATLVVRSPLALRRVLYAPGELGFGRAYVAGELDVEGDLLWLLATVRHSDRQLQISPAMWLVGVRAALELGILGPPLPAPSEESRIGGWLRPRVRDARGIAHHYDVGNDFYRLVLGPTMTYSCARFVHPDDSLEVAQTSKHDLICRKLGLRPGLRLLDVGCGWGTLVRHAASHYGVRAVGITLSHQQHQWAEAATRDAGLADRVEIRFQDFRDLGGEDFDAICSVGMFEHVGRAQVASYFSTLHGLLRPGGRLLNHAISHPRGSHYGRRSFLLRYVFPNGELRDVGATVAAMQVAGLEARDVECLREHYALTLRAWVANLERHWA